MGTSLSVLPSIVHTASMRPNALRPRKSWCSARPFTATTESEAGLDAAVPLVPGAGLGVQRLQLAKAALAASDRSESWLPLSVKQ
jgi:hypothetical protein